MVLLWCLIITVYGSAKSFAGERLILTLPETTDQNTLRRWIRSTKPAGVMLLAYHVSRRSTTKALCKFLQEEAARYSKKPLLIAIDWEGGIVSRPSETGGFTSIPSPWRLPGLVRLPVTKPGCLLGAK